MRTIILIFGLAIIAAGVLMLARPSLLTDFLKRHAGAPYLHQLAIGVRLVLGMVLIGYAKWSRFPMLLGILGGLSIAAAIFFAVLPQPKFEQLIHWTLVRFDNYMRPAAVAVTLFGAFLVVAVI